VFRDVSPLLSDSMVFSFVIDEFVKLLNPYNPEVLVAIDSRGFIFGAPIAIQTGLPLVMMRKEGKLPGKVTSVKYGLEYGTDTLEVQHDVLESGKRVAIIDDVLASGGTLAAARELIEKMDSYPVCAVLVIELLGLNARKFLRDLDILSLVKY